MVLESKNFTIFVARSEVEFICYNKDQNVCTIVLRNHVLSVKAPESMAAIQDWILTNSQNSVGLISCEAIQIGPRENLVIIPPPQGPAGIMIPPNLRHR